MSFAATWMDPETIILSDRERQIPYDITLMWNLNKDTNALIYNQKQNNRCRKQNYGYQTGRGRGIYQKFGINICTPLYKTDKQGPTVYHRELYSIFCNNLYSKGL